MTEATPNAVGASAPPPLVFLGGFILGEAIDFFLRIPIWPSTWIQLLGILPLVIGIGLFASAIRTFAVHKTPADPREPTTELVQDGPYGSTRNPIYLSFTLIYLGSSLIFNSLTTLVILVPVLILIDRRQILREEEYLERKFGEEYRRYKAKVRRWI